MWLKWYQLDLEWNTSSCEYSDEAFYFLIAGPDTYEYRSSLLAHINRHPQRTYRARGWGTDAW